MSENNNASASTLNDSALCLPNVRRTASIAILAIGLLAWIASIISIWSYGFLVSAASMPLFIAGMVLWPSRGHLAVGVIGLAWAFMWIAFALHDVYGIRFEEAGRILINAC